MNNSNYITIDLADESRGLLSIAESIKERVLDDMPLGTVETLTDLAFMFALYGLATKTRFLKATLTDEPTGKGE